MPRPSADGAPSPWSSASRSGLHPRRRRAAVPFAVAALMVAACDGGPEPSAVPGGQARSDRPDLVGRLITVAARQDGQNVVESLDLATGARGVVWTTGPEIADWRVAPGGDRAAYRATIRSPRAAESIEVRELTEGAAPRVVATVDPEVERIGGLAFASDGAALLYVRQAIGADGAAALWLAGARPGAEKVAGNDRRHRDLALPASPAPSLVLVAWASRVDRAALREDAPDGGPIAGVRFSAASGGRGLADLRSAAPGVDAALAAAPDVSKVAWLPRDGGAIVVDDGAGGPREVAGPDEGTWPALPLFDPAGAVLAWQVNPEDGGPAWVRLVDVRDGGPPRALRLQGQALQPLAFAPDGAWLLLGAGEPGVLDPVRLVVADVATGGLAPVAWLPPDGLWGATWVPAR